MEIQCRIGADIHMAYDELTSLADSYEYNKEALARTERWAKRSLQVHKKHCDDLGYHQALYGVLQGGRWEDLRRSTARKLATMDFDGYGLGGAFLKESLGEILRWCCEELPEDKPRHLLGLSHPDDILIGTEMGADTFDCVAPTREARHGRIYTRHGNIAIKKFADSDELIEEGCDCPTCQAGWTRGQLRALLKSPDPKDREKYFNLCIDPQPALHHPSDRRSQGRHPGWYLRPVQGKLLKRLLSEERIKPNDHRRSRARPDGSSAVRLFSFFVPLCACITPMTVMLQ